jgi:hypothetical protein
MNKIREINKTFSFSFILGIVAEFDSPKNLLNNKESLFAQLAAQSHVNSATEKQKIK